MLTALVVVALAAQAPSRANLLMDMQKRVFEVTGANPRECGRHPSRQVDGKVVYATRQQLQASLECARDAVRTGQPFWTFVEVHGIDSWVAHGLLRTASGEVQFFDYDSDPCGGPRCGGDLSLFPCAEPVV